MLILPGDIVQHPEYGQGTVAQVLGGTVLVDFFGDALDVRIDELTLIKTSAPCVPDNTLQINSQDKINFRKAFEALNLGVVPPDPTQLIDLTISSKEYKEEISSWLRNASMEGLCKVIFGDYGSGKSHMLKFIRCMSLQAGWAVAYLEFDPKAADPAKPHLVYHNLMMALEFPSREDGSQAQGFIGFIKEVRDHWDSKKIRHNDIFRRSPWFTSAFEIIMQYPHLPDRQEYLDACYWLAGNQNSIQVINELARNKGLRTRVPRMPLTKETAEIYVFHLVVVNELCKLLGYRGLMIILDEAEHVRGYNVRRQERADNFFDLLARAAHVPDEDDNTSPAQNDHGLIIPPFWEDGPHFGLVVGLTEADTFVDPALDLRDACVFLREESDRVMLTNPVRADYGLWCDHFLQSFHSFYPLETQLLKSKEVQYKVRECLCESYPEAARDTTLRNHIKLACLVPCILISHPGTTLDQLCEHIRKAASECLGNALPWE